MAILKLLVLVLLALGARGDDHDHDHDHDSSPDLEELFRDLHLRLNLMSLEFHEQMEQLVTEQQLLRQSVEKLSWVVDRVDQSMKNIENNHDVVMRNLSHVTSQSDAIMVNQQFCANHDRLRDLYFETIPRCQGPPLPPTTTEPPPTTTENPTIYSSCRDAPPISGVYNIALQGGYLVRVFCEQELLDGGWLTFQSRLDGSVDFNRSWFDYRNGFGDASGEYWLGLENLYFLAGSSVELLIDMEDFAGNSQYALYSAFRVDYETNNYKLHLGGTFSGTAGNALSSYFSEPFMTFDNTLSTNHASCAEKLASGFWHYDCGVARERNNLNGIYGFDKGQQGVWWGTFNGATSQNRAPLKRVRMMIRSPGTFGEQIEWFDGPKD
ncbi:ficolin-3-like [Culex quinquefasciatus]|uniref:ficolin-3-like n=1 Tax=Culex quinquefasciatus TaxID=7176 RepID=UPI0018E3F6F9|nr:ficolin-3-like [Culex quinquefasciatus]